MLGRLVFSTMIFLSTVCGAGTTHAQVDECDGTPAERLECAAIAFQKADADLRTFVNSTKTGANRETGLRLAKAHVAWQSFRDAECSLVGASMIGSDEEFTLVQDCLASKTKARIDELRETL